MVSKFLLIFFKSQMLVMIVFLVAILADFTDCLFGDYWNL
jgi:hypothetical protein